MVTVAANTKCFEMRHVVTFEETNLVGNVYYVNLVSWQGRCRELFLREHVSETLAELSSGKLRLVTAHASCEFFDEFQAFDEVVVRMRLLKFIPFGVSLGFTYSKAGTIAIDLPPDAVRARGRQDIKFLTARNEGWELTEIPPAFLSAVQRYAA